MTAIASPFYCLDPLCNGDRAGLPKAIQGSRNPINLTKDEDFTALRLPLLWLRCGNATNEALFGWLEPRWVEIERLLAEGEGVIEAR